MGTDNLTIQVYDEDLGKDDSLGSTTLDIIALQKNKILSDKWIPLMNCKSGEILISAEFILLEKTGEAKQKSALTEKENENISAAHLVDKEIIKKEVTQQISKENIFYKKRFKTPGKIEKKKKKKS